MSNVKALLMADGLEFFSGIELTPAAAELRRLHKVNEDLMDALRQIIDLPEDSRIHYKVARKALAKATGEQDE